MTARRLLLLCWVGVFAVAAAPAQWIHSDVSTLFPIRFAVAGPDVFLGSAYGLFHSSDFGASWRPADSALSGVQITGLGFSGNRLFVGTETGKVLISSDTGKTWTASRIDSTSPALLALTWSGSVTFAGTSRGIYRSLDSGMTWTRVDSTRTDVQVLLANGGSLFAGTHSHGAARSADSGAHWQTMALGAFSVRDFLVADSVLYGGLEALAEMGGGGVLRSTDFGTHWTDASKGLPLLFVPPPLFTPTSVYAFAAVGKSLFAGTDYGVYVSTNSGARWDSVNTGLATTGGWGIIRSLAVTDSFLLAASYSNGVWRRRLSELTPPVADTLADLFPLGVGNSWEYAFWHKLYEQSDFGIVRSLTDTGPVRYRVVGKTDFPDSVAWFIRQSRTLHRSGSPEYYHSADSMVVDSLTFTLVELKANHHKLYLQRAIQTESTSDFGADVYNYGFAFWRNLADSESFFRYGPVDSNGIASFHPSGTLPPARWFTLKKGLGLTSVQLVYGLYTLQIGSTFHLASADLMAVPSGHREGMPQGFVLYQNYPNPFNPTTTIRYSLPHRAHVALTVFNLLGQQVAELVDGEIEAGYHEIQFNAGNLASGVYFYLLQAGSFVETKKLLLTR